MEALMERARADGLVFLVLGNLLFLLISFSIEIPSGHAHGLLLQDFKAIYYSTRCLLERHDPYSAADVEKVYLAESGADLNDHVVAGQLQGVVYTVYFPTTFLLVAPFALLAWNTAHVAWMIVAAVALALASFAVWHMSTQGAPLYSGVLLALMMTGAFSVLWVGNAAGLVVALSVIAAACFLEGRWGAAGLVCLAIALMLKPHNAWLVWLYFVLAGGPGRRYAIRSSMLAGVCFIASAAWVWSLAPHWAAELRANLQTASGPLGRDNPGPAALGTHTAGMIVDLRTVFSLVRDAPAFYSTASALLGGGLIAAWIWMVCKTPRTRTASYLALAAAAPLTLLPNYHRTYDTYLLLLCVPAAALLWRHGGATRWISAVLNAAAIVLTSPFILTLLVNYADRPHPDLSTRSGRLLMLLLERPIPLLLLGLAVLYLWALSREMRTTRGFEAAA